MCVCVCKTKTYILRILLHRIVFIWIISQWKVIIACEHFYVLTSLFTPCWVSVNLGRNLSVTVTVNWNNDIANRHGNVIRILWSGEHTSWETVRGYLGIQNLIISIFILLVKKKTSYRKKNPIEIDFLRVYGRVWKSN